MSAFFSSWRHVSASSRATTEKGLLLAGNVAEKLEQYDRALDSYQRALVYNAKSPQALTQIASIYRHKEMFGDAAKYFSLALQEDANNGEVWGALGVSKMTFSNSHD